MTATPRRILLLNERDPSNPMAGGAEVHIFEIFKRLAARGHYIRVLAAAYRGCRIEQFIDGIRVRRLVNRYPYYVVVPREARREAICGEYDIVVDVLNKVPFLSPWFVPKPCMAIVHHLMGTTAFTQAAFPVATATWLSEKLIPRAYSRTPMLAISPSTKMDLEERGLDSDLIRVVPPGLDHSRYGTGTPAAEREPLILWIGRLERYKRADDMLEAMVEIRRRIPAARLLLIGDGKERPTLIKKASRMGLDECTEFTGFITENEKISYLQRAAVVVNTSEKEGWGMTVIEGAACATPSVSSDVPGLRDSVRDGETGLLYPLGDVGALRNAIIGLIEDPEERSRLGIEAMGWSQGFTWDRVATQVENLIEETIAAYGASAT